jgi:peptide/nickel transport system substrate-binding protein
MNPLPQLRSAALALCAAALVAASAAACSSNSSGGASGTAAGGGVLTIQGDVGNPTLVEDFNPLNPTGELGGSRLIYAPLETVSTVNGSYTPFLATGYKFTNPTTLVYTSGRA